MFFFEISSLISQQFFGDQNKRKKKGHHLFNAVRASVSCLVERKKTTKIIFSSLRSDSFEAISFILYPTAPWAVASGSPVSDRHFPKVSEL